MSSPVQALQGQVPGVIITRSSGAPGDESWGMKLRGAVSANSTDPLVIIDGVEYESVNELRILPVSIHEYIVVYIPERRYWIGVNGQINISV